MGFYCGYMPGHESFVISRHTNVEPLLKARNLTCKHTLGGHIASPATNNESKLPNKIINIVITTIINQLLLHIE